MEILMGFLIGTTFWLVAVFALAIVMRNKGEK